ncbi:MAG: PTS sugar transporter subunit IIA [Deltaproteobacteria bacterium]|nr:PTS sugar transporter subunit IIA [Deltaproteobacteria bacterium]
MQLSVRDAATLLEVSEKTVYRWARKGEIPFSRVNDQYRFNRVELLEWATANRVPVSPMIFSEPEAQGLRLPSLTEALQAGGVFYRIAGRDVPSVLREVVHHMRLPDEVDREHLFQVLLAREALGSTGVGEGIAIPHVRNPIVLHVPRATVTLCFLETPIDFQSLDGKPVNTLFTVISPTVKGHLHLLSRLAFGLRDAGVRRVLAEQAGREAILQSFEAVEASLPAPSGGQEPVR